MTTATTLTVFVNALPQRILSSNAGSRSRRDPWSVAAASAELKDETMHAIRALMDQRMREWVDGPQTSPLMYPNFDRARVTVTLRCTTRRPKLEQCPRCLSRHLAGDAPSWAKDGCACYRPTDVGNTGGQPLKPILDAFTWLEIWPDDDWVHVPEIVLRIERVEAIADEGICIEVVEVTAA